MAINETCNNTGILQQVSDEEWNGYLKQYLIYSVTGSITLLSNLCIFLTIPFNKELRTKYFLILALAVADFFSGFGYLTAGIHRLMIIFAGRQKELVSRLTCALRIYNIGWIACEPLISAVSSVVAVERFVAITWPLEYSKKWPMRKIITWTTLGVYVFVGVLSVVQFVSGYLSEDCVGTICFTSYGVGLSVRKVVLNFILACTAVCVVAYLMAVYGIQKQKKKLKDGVQNTANKQTIERQIRITKMMSFIIILQVISVFMPFGAAFFLVDYSPELYKAVMPYLFSFTSLNSGLNFFIYAITNPELRAAFRNRLFKCRSSHHTQHQVSARASTTGNAGRSHRSPKVHPEKKSSIPHAD